MSSETSLGTLPFDKIFVDTNELALVEKKIQWEDWYVGRYPTKGILIRD